MLTHVDDYTLTGRRGYRTHEDCLADVLPAFVILRTMSLDACCWTLVKLATILNPWNRRVLLAVVFLEQIEL